MLAAVGTFPEEPEGALRLYYLVFFPDDPLRNVLCVARSSDLATWEKPDLGNGDNIVMRSSGLRPGYGVFMPCRIVRDTPGEAEAEPWTMLYWDHLPGTPAPGFYLAASWDGLAWEPIVEQPIMTNANDAASIVRARGHGPDPFGPAAYYIYQQTWRHNPDLPRERDNLKGLHRRISIWRAGSLGGAWLGPIVVLEPDRDDPPDVQFYFLTPFLTDEGYAGLLHCHHTADQTMDIQLVHSLDGWTWTRALDRQPLLAPGEPGRFDCGMITAWPEPVPWQGRLLLFYSGRATVHDGRPRYPNRPLPDPPNGIGVAELDPGILSVFGL